MKKWYCFLKISINIHQNSLAWDANDEPVNWRLLGWAAGGLRGRAEGCKIIGEEWTVKQSPSNTQQASNQVWLKLSFNLGMWNVVALCLNGTFQLSFYHQQKSSFHWGHRGPCWPFRWEWFTLSMVMPWTGQDRLKASVLIATRLAQITSAILLSTVDSTFCFRMHKTVPGHPQTDIHCLANGSKVQTIQTPTSVQWKYCWTPVVSEFGPCGLSPTEWERNWCSPANAQNTSQRKELPTFCFVFGLEHNFKTT